MRRIHNKQNRKQLADSLKRAQSHSHFVLTQNKTLAQLNHPSNRHPSLPYHPSRPLRVSLPDYFNVPRFQDQDLFKQSQKGALFQKVRAQGQLRRKVKELGILAQGMRRAKNIKEQSRYYFTQSVLQHNCRAFSQSIASLQKFLKIVLFIRDEKSVQLALNAIGAEYMAMGDPKTAIQFHRKQGSINARADTFLSHANCGLCFQMLQDYESAIAEYAQAEKSTKMDQNDSRRKFLQKATLRASGKQAQVFITSNQKQQSSSIVSQRASKARIVAAIRSAQQHLERFLSDMGQSFVEEK